jgi:uncharacterized membrane protein SpoIIM required for sporulation
MREAQFVKDNSANWKAFESNIRSGQPVDPDALAEQYIRLTDDLSYARTFYPESNITRYLNELTVVAHSRIYKNKKERSSRFVTFWKYEVAESAYILRKPFLFAFMIFAISVLLGLISQMRDESFARLILGDSYVNMTLENIKKGDPLGVYKEGAPVLMFLEIAINNIRVAMAAFAAGILFSVVTGYLLFYNGFMVSVFLYFLHQYGVPAQSALPVWIHGTLELSAIILAGGAGLHMGNSILFPGTYSRGYSLRMSAKHGLKILISLIPVFLTAAFLESFVTRHTEMPLWLSFLIISVSFAFITFYYIIYPTHLHKKTSHATTNS